MKSFRKTKLSLLISFSLLSAAAVAADEDSKETEKEAQEETLEIINVVGIRSSLRQNLNNKRHSDAIVDSINTEDIAKNPDKNMAEALQRIPGVQITREFGEGSQISIRGTSPELTNTLVNGQAARSASHRPGQGESNSFNFSNIPAERVSKIEVFKSARADIDAGGIGGTVILHTKKPLEQLDGYGYVNVEGEYNDSSEKSSPQISTAYNFKNDDETFGASIAVSLQERNAYRTGFESGGIASGTGFYQTDAITCPTEECLSSDIKLRHMNNHNLIVTRHMANNGYTHGDLAAVSDGPAYWDNFAGDWGAADDVMDPVYLDPNWALFWGSRRDAGLGQTPGRTLGTYVFAPAFETDESRLDTTLNFQWAPVDELSINLELNQNKTDRSNKSDNLFAQPYRMTQLLYGNAAEGIDPRLVMDSVQDIVLSATHPVDGVNLIRGAGGVWDGNGYYSSRAKWGEMIRRESNDRDGSETEQNRVHLTVDYTTDNLTAKLQVGRTSAESLVINRKTTMATRYGDYVDPYSGDQYDLQIPSYEGVNLHYGYDPATGKARWGVEADPSLTGDELAAAQERAEKFLLAPTNEFYLLQGGLTNTERTRENVEDFLQGDFTYEMDNRFFIDSIKTGVKYRNIQRSEVYYSENARFHGYANEASPFPLILAEDIVGGTVSGMDSAGHDIPNEYFDIDRAKRDALLANNFLLVHAEGTPNEVLCESAIAATGSTNYVGCRSGMTEAKGEFYDVTEEILAYYAMANFSGELFSGNSFRGNVGIRIVDTQRESVSNENKKDENGQPMYYPADPSEEGYIEELASFAMYEPLSQESSTKDYLPSFNLAVDITDNLVFRAAASKNISHPSLYQMRSTFNLVTERFRKLTNGLEQDLTPEGNAQRLPMGSQRRGSVGNADLGSYTAVNSELGLEWYFDDSSLLAVTAFQKDITNMVRSDSRVQDLTYLGEEGRTDNNGYKIFGDYVVSSYFNIGEQLVKGVEFQLQHDFDNGFGALINYTYTDVPAQSYTDTTFEYEVADETDIEYWVDDAAQREYYEVTGFTSETTTQTQPMYGQSKDTLNTSVYYENEDFSVRLSYNYRSEFASGSDLGGIVYTDARQQLDFKATYRVLDNVSATFSVINLTNENVVQYIDSSQIVNDPVINKMKWIDEVDDNGVATGNRVIAVDDNGVNIVESSITGEEAFQMLSEASGIPVAELKPYYENRLNKVTINEWTNGRRFYAGVNWTF